MHELHYYLETLLDHRCSSGNGDCPECKSLQRIYEFMQTELFSSVIYAETHREPHKSARFEAQALNRAVASLRRPRGD
ncbi:MAG TPA: hypothetical protein VMG35_30895 [Bryobacteraceae bacterium]|nr:hypothetical protein [Bryobacteraceae bacterium]